MGDFCSSRVLCESILGQTKKHDVCRPICVHQIKIVYNICKRCGKQEEEEEGGEGQ